MNSVSITTLVWLGLFPLLTLLVYFLFIPTARAGTSGPTHPAPNYSVKPTYPAPRDYGYRPTRWHPWNRSTILPVFPGMQPPPGREIRRRRPPAATLPPLPFEDEEEEPETETDGLPGDLPLQPNGDQAPAPPPDLDPGLPLPGEASQEPAPDSLPPILPDTTEPAPPDDLFQPPPEDTDDTEPPDDLFPEPAESARPDDQPPVGNNGRQGGGWKTARHLATGWRSPAGQRPAGKTEPAPTATNHFATYRSKTPVQPLQPTWPQNPLRTERFLPSSADASRVVPVAAWDYDQQ